MGETRDSSRGNVSDVLDAADTTTSDTALDGGREVQPLPTGGEDRSEEPSSASYIGQEYSGFGETLSGGEVEWIVVQLKELAEQLPVGDIVKDLAYYLDTDAIRVHFPASRDGYLQKESPLANYVFLTADLDDSRLLRLERSPLVDTVLCSPGTVGRWRRVTKVTESELEEMVARESFSTEVKVGDQVAIESGTWAGLYGTAVDVFGNRVKVYVELHSRRRLVTLNREELTPVREN